MIECLHQSNPAGGFQSVHNCLCNYAGCEENAESHVSVPGTSGLMYCANHCAKHCRAIQTSHRSATISEINLAA